MHGACSCAHLQAGAVGCQCEARVKRDGAAARAALRQQHIQHLQPRGGVNECHQARRGHLGQAQAGAQAGAVLWCGSDADVSLMSLMPARCRASSRARRHGLLTRAHLWAAVQHKARQLPPRAQQLAQPRVAARVAAEEAEAVQPPARGRERLQPVVRDKHAECVAFRAADGQVPQLRAVARKLAEHRVSDVNVEQRQVREVGRRGRQRAEARLQQRAAVQPVRGEAAADDAQAGAVAREEPARARARERACRALRVGAAASSAERVRVRASGVNAAAPLT